MNEFDDQQNDRLGRARVRILPRRTTPRIPLKQRVRHRQAQLKKGVYLIPSLFTTGNLICGFFSLISTFNGDYFQASVFIILANVLDGLDGLVARVTKTTSQFGVELDSLADLVSFGVAPAVLVYYWALVPWSTWGWLAACLYVVCGALRLARFNVQATRPKTLAEGTAKVGKKNFVGLPIPAAAGLLASIVHFAPRPLSAYIANRVTLYTGLLMGLVAVLSVLMVSTIKYSSFKTVGAGRRSTITVMPVIAAVGALVWLYSRYVLLAIVSIYVLHGLLFRFAALFRPRRAVEE